MGFKIHRKISVIAVWRPLPARCPRLISRPLDGASAPSYMAALLITLTAVGYCRKHNTVPVCGIFGNDIRCHEFLDPWFRKRFESRRDALSHSRDPRLLDALVPSSSCRDHLGRLSMISVAKIMEKLHDPTSLVRPLCGRRQRPSLLKSDKVRSSMVIHTFSHETTPPSKLREEIGKRTSFHVLHGWLQIDPALRELDDYRDRHVRFRGSINRKPRCSPISDGTNEKIRLPSRRGCVRFPRMFLNSRMGLSSYTRVLTLRKHQMVLPRPKRRRYISTSEILDALHGISFAHACPPDLQYRRSLRIRTA